MWLDDNKHATDQSCFGVSVELAVAFEAGCPAVCGGISILLCFKVLIGSQAQRMHC
jgi:hypothetical protein